MFRMRDHRLIKSPGVEFIIKNAMKKGFIKDNDNVYAVETGILGSGLYARVVILDASEIEDEAAHGGMLYLLKKINIKDGETYQIDNAGNLLMEHNAYKKCRIILKKFRVRPVNIRD